MMSETCKSCGETRPYDQMLMSGICLDCHSKELFYRKFQEQIGKLVPVHSDVEVPAVYFMGRDLREEQFTKRDVLRVLSHAIKQLNYWMIQGGDISGKNIIEGKDFLLESE